MDQAEQSPLKDAIAALEAWHSKEKCRSVKIDIDNGYGATCWRVELRRGNYGVYCSETNFIANDANDPKWVEHEGCLHTVVVDGDEMEKWPGLAKTILHAIECADRFWAKKD